MGELSRPLAVVTGASTGIGFELARQFVQHGYEVVIAADEARIEEAAERLRAEGGRVQVVQADLSTAAGCETLERYVDELARPVDAVALNAGLGEGGDFARETSLAQEMRLIGLNCGSTVHLAKWAARRMVARGKGRILITASIAALMPATLSAVYGASKAFDLSFAASLHEELRDTGVTVTAFLPGPTDTEFFRRAHMEDTRVGAEKKKANQPDDVARQAFEAMLAGKERVATGNLSVKLQAAFARFLPESLKARMHRRLAEPIGLKH